MRIDPLVGLEKNKTVDINLDDSDIEACYRVIEILGKNPAFFKLVSDERGRVRGRGGG